MSRASGGGGRADDASLKGENGAFAQVMAMVMVMVMALVVMMIMAVVMVMVIMASMNKPAISVSSHVTERVRSPR
jgi:hypothetical protein